jgi:hypothetical protein
VRYTAIAKTSGEKITLERAVGSRVAELAPEDRRLLEALNVSAGPAAPDQLGVVSGAKDVTGGLRRLQGAALIRYASGPAPRVTAYHDRIREIIVRYLDAAEIKRWHVKWAAAIEASPHPDLDALCRHLQGAGDEVKSIIYTERAADQAMTGLAFDHAASLYHQVLRLLPHADTRQGEVYAKLGQSLADAGRARESARAFVKAAEHQNDEARVLLCWRAAEQALMGGDFEIGIPLLEKVLPHFGIRLPRGKWSTILALARIQVKLALIGSGPPASDESVSELVRQRIEICSALAYLLYFFDPLLGFYFISLSALYRLCSANLSHRPVGLVMKALNQALLHPERCEAIEQIIREAISLAREQGDAVELAHTLMHAGLVGSLLLKPLESVAVSFEAARLIRQHSTGAAAVYGIQMVQQTLAAMHFFAGDFNKLRAVIHVARTENLKHKSLFHDWYLDMFEFQATLAADDPDAARQIIERYVGKRSREKLTFVDVHFILAQVMLDAYEGRPEEGYARLKAHLTDIRKTGIMRTKTRHFEIYLWLGNSALAAGIGAASSPGGEKRSRRWFALARTHAKRLRRLGLKPSRAVANALLAGLAAHAGDRDEAMRLLRESVDPFESHGMQGLVAGVRRSLGLLLGGDEGQSLVAEADAALTALGVKNPAHSTATWLPGFDARN